MKEKKEKERARWARQVQVGYFKAGSALEIGDDYQLTLGITLTY